MRYTYLPLFIITLGLGCQSGESSNPDANTETINQSATPVDQASGPLGPGAEAPDLVAEGWINGKAPSKEQLLGKVVVVDTWAYW